MKCKLHPDIETNLRCGKCDQLICPKCLVQTPVGARCPQCANVKRLPVFDVSFVYYLRAIAAGLIAATIIGIMWPSIPFGGFLWFFVAMGIGYAISEVISRAVNHKRGLGLQIIAGLCMILCYVIRSILEDNPSFINELFDVYGLIALLIGIVMATGRLRGN